MSNLDFGGDTEDKPPMYSSSIPYYDSQQHQDQPQYELSKEQQFAQIINK